MRIALGWGAAAAAAGALAGAAGLLGPPGTVAWGGTVGLAGLAIGLAGLALRASPRRGARPAVRAEDVVQTVVSATVVDQAIRRFEPEPAAGAPRPAVPAADLDQPFDLYISYARADNESPHAEPFWVEAFLQRLNAARRQIGVVGDYNVCFDASEVRGVSDWDTRLSGGLHRSAALLALLSPRWLASEVCHREWRVFVDRSAPGSVPCVVPVLIEPFAVTPRSSPQEITAWLEELPEHVAVPTGDPRSVATDVHERVHDVLQHPMSDLAPAWDCPWPELLDNREIDGVLVGLARQIEAGLAQARPALSTPYDPFFVGRADELVWLRGAFPSRLAVVTSPGHREGWGRSSLVAQHALMRSADYPGGVYWLSCEEAGSLDDALSPIAAELSVGREAPAVVSALRERCGGRGACLLVLHGATDPGLLSDGALRPVLDASWIHMALVAGEVCGHGHRRTVIEVGRLTAEEGAELIRRRIPGRRFESDEEHGAARAIAEHVQGDPRALQAAAIEIGMVAPHRCAALLEALEGGDVVLTELLARHVARLPSTPASSHR